MPLTYYPRNMFAKQNILKRFIPKFGRCSELYKQTPPRLESIIVNKRAYLITTHFVIFYWHFNYYIITCKTSSVDSCFDTFRELYQSLFGAFAHCRVILFSESGVAKLVFALFRRNTKKNCYYIRQLSPLRKF